MLKLSIIGFIGQDAKTVDLNGHKAIKFSVGISDKKDAPTTWIDVTYFHNGAIAPYLKKGVKVYIDGEVKIGAYVNKTNAPIPSINLTVNSLKFIGDATNK